MSTTAPADQMQHWLDITAADGSYDVDEQIAADFRALVAIILDAWDFDGAAMVTAMGEVAFTAANERGMDPGPAAGISAP